MTLTLEQVHPGMEVYVNYLGNWKKGTVLGVSGKVPVPVHRKEMTLFEVCLGPRTIHMYWSYEMHPVEQEELPIPGKKLSWKQQKAMTFL